MTDEELLSELFRLHGIQFEMIGWCVSWKFPAVKDQMEQACRVSMEQAKKVIALKLPMKDELIRRAQRMIVATPHEARKLTSRYIRVMANRKRKAKAIQFQRFEELGRKLEN